MCSGDTDRHLTPCQNGRWQSMRDYIFIRSLLETIHSVGWELLNWGVTPNVQKYHQEEQGCRSRFNLCVNFLRSYRTNHGGDTLV